GEHGCQHNVGSASAVRAEPVHAGDGDGDQHAEAQPEVRLGNDVPVGFVAVARLHYNALNVPLLSFVPPTESLRFRHAGTGPARTLDRGPAWKIQQFSIA